MAYTDAAYTDIDTGVPWVVDIESPVVAPGTQALANDTRVAVPWSPTAVEHCSPGRLVVPLQVVTVLPGQAHKRLAAAGVWARDTNP